MKILHLTPDLNFAIKFVLPIAEIQSVDGNQVTICTHSNEYQTSAQALESIQLEYHQIRFIKLNLKFQLNAFAYFRLVISLVRELKLIEPDVIISHTSLDSFIPLIVSRFATNAKLVYFNHGVPFLGYDFPLRMVFKLIEFINLRIAHLTLTIGESMRACLAPLASNNKRVVFVPPGSACGIRLIASDYEQIVKMRRETRHARGITNDERVVVYVGRPVKRKGYFDLLEAWDAFKDKSNYRLILVGPAEADMIRLNKRPSSNVYFLGYQSDPTPFYLIADVLCIPSHHEGLGYCYIEASAAGCVPICSKIPGPTDFVKHGETGMTCRTGDLQSIADSIFVVLADKQLRERLARNAFLHALSYERTSLAPKISSAIQQ
ncbi:glycosyltransferase [Geobacter sp. AOG2]|uniref:glycosyltransferase n=1 Tax=Geobacter sp. AOG2 TaxID=1566347 RepID=UPI001CC4D79D|nr:glycosyltransferase [Geobacter sp. AOG2]GFE62248.1 N-acetyl-alpha-D-glucosaminyl L-malate synthase BshA [Geobacter sp. AOG2]